MPRVSIVKNVKTDGHWTIRSIPRKQSGGFDWGALPDGRYLIEWYENGRRCRGAAGITSAEAIEAQRKKRHELKAVRPGLAPKPTVEETPPVRPLRKLIDHYLDQIETLKKRNTHRKYEAVLGRFAGHFPGRPFESMQVEELNDYVIALMRKRMSPNTVLHNVVIVAQFFRRYGRPGITRELQLSQKTSSLPVEYTEEDLARFFGACEGWEGALFSTLLLAGMREQEVQHLFWTDINFRLRTIRVTAKAKCGFYPKRWEEREIPVPTKLVEVLERHPKSSGSSFVFPSPTGNREQHMLDHCKEVAKRAALDQDRFDLKTFRSTYATRTRRAGFDDRTVQQWMGHKSLETTMRHLVPASDVRDRLDQVPVPAGTATSARTCAVRQPGRRRKPRAPASAGG
ncbi:MAG: tyrosine-type recombinase/integrase [Bryobacteraceae bacterium]